MADMDNGFLEGNGIVILLLFLLMFGWGNGFGGYGNNGLQGALTRAEMADGFNTTEIKNGINSLTGGQYALNNSVLNNRYDSAIGMANLDKSVMQSRYDTLLGQNALAAQIAQNRYDAAIANQVMQSQMCNSCADLKTAIHAEGESVRQMIQNQTIEDLKQQLSLAQTAVSNAAQTNTILGQMGRWVANAPAAYGGCGCGCA